MKLDRQIGQALAFQTPPHSSYEMRSYTVEECAHKLVVTRSYSQPGFKTEWHECIFIGPRGGCKTIYKTFY